MINFPTRMIPTFIVLLIVAQNAFAASCCGFVGVSAPVLPSLSSLIQ